MRTYTRIVHRTRDRIRLRIPERRKDLPYFLDLYEDLRRAPDVTDVVINPSTASVLLFFPRESAKSVFHSLERSGLLVTDGRKSSNKPRPSPIQDFFSNRSSTVTDMGTVLLTMSIGIAIHQALHGRILIPTLAALWHAHNLIVCRKRGKELLDPTP